MTQLPMESSVKLVSTPTSMTCTGLDFKTCEVLVRINKQSPDIAGGVHISKDEMGVGAAEFGYASDETADCMPLTYSMATHSLG